jgi:hypothetical protein
MGQDIARKSLSATIGCLTSLGRYDYIDDSIWKALFQSLMKEMRIGLECIHNTSPEISGRDAMSMADDVDRAVRPLLLETLRDISQVGAPVSNTLLRCTKDKDRDGHEGYTSRQKRHTKISPAIFHLIVPFKADAEHE